MFDKLPMMALLSSVAIILTIVFFITSSDSGPLIIDLIAAGGKIDTPVLQRVFWCTVEGLVAIILLGMSVCVWRGLHSEMRESRCS